MSAFLLVALTLAVLPGGEVDAADRTSAKIDPALLAEAKAEPNARFAIIARGVASRARSPIAMPISAPGERADTADEAERALRASGGQLQQTLSIVGAAAGMVTGKQILQLANDGRIARVVKDEELVAADESSDTSRTATPTAGVREVNAPAAWSAGLTGAGVRVAVLDSGVAAHPDLLGRIVASVDLTGSDWRVSSTPLGDPGGHGTHVAGLIAGNGTRSGGAYTGVAPGADIVSVRVLDASGSARLSTVLHGIQWVLANRGTYRIRVVNMSFGARARSSYQADLLAAATEALTFAGIVPVVAAGNNGAGSSTITTPATDPFVLTVGAVDDRGTPSPLDDLVATWSSRGPTAFDALLKPDVVAPGRRIVSLRVPSSTLDVSYPERRVHAAEADRADYFTLSGTSMAAPIVAGAVALLLQRYPALTPQQVKAQLRATARPLIGMSPFDQGAGLIDAFGAISTPLTAAPLSAWRVSDAFATDLARLLYGQPLVWRDLAFNGGVDSRGLRWTDISWENITWNDISWENLSWESFTWTNISWETFVWTDISWELIVPLTGNGSGGWVLVD